MEKAPKGENLRDEINKTAADVLLQKEGEKLRGEINEIAQRVAKEKEEGMGRSGTGKGLDSKIEQKIGPTGEIIYPPVSEPIKPKNVEDAYSPPAPERESNQKGHIEPDVSKLREYLAADSEKQRQEGYKVAENSHVDIKAEPAKKDESATVDAEKRAFVNFQADLVETYVGMNYGLGKRASGQELLPEEKKSLVDLKKKAKVLFGALTGENLDAKIKEKTIQLIEGQGGKVIKKKEYFSQENVQKAVDRATLETRRQGITAAWSRLSPEEQRSFENIQKYATYLEEARNDLVKKGLAGLSKDVFCSLLVSFDIQKAQMKRAGLFGKNVIIQEAFGGTNPVEGNKKIINDWFSEHQKAFDAKVKQEAKVKMDEGFARGRRKLLTAEKTVTKQLVLDAAMRPGAKLFIEAKTTPIVPEKTPEELHWEKEEDTINAKLNERLNKLDQEMARVTARYKLSEEQSSILKRRVVAGENNLIGIDGVPAEVLAEILKLFIAAEQRIKTEFEKSKKMIRADRLMEAERKKQQAIAAAKEKDQQEINETKENLDKIFKQNEQENKK